jgi:hypothetical protein
MIWNCKKCGDLPASQVSLSEECISCQWPITYRDSVIVPDELAEHREAKERSQRLEAINKRRSIKG